MIKLVDLLNEGVYDPGIFKAVFTGGGPGSGKSIQIQPLKLHLKEQAQERIYQ